MRRSRTPVSEQYRMVMEARQSGLSDAEWCRQNGIDTALLSQVLSAMKSSLC